MRFACSSTAINCVLTLCLMFESFWRTRNLKNRESSIRNITAVVTANHLFLARGNICGRGATLVQLSGTWLPTLTAKGSVHLYWVTSDRRGLILDYGSSLATAEVGYNCNSRTCINSWDHSVEVGGSLHSSTFSPFPLIHVHTGLLTRQHRWSQEFS